MKTIITMGTRHTIQHVMVRFHHIRPGFARVKARTWLAISWLGLALFLLLKPGGSAYAQTQAGNALAFAAVNGDYAALQNTGVSGGSTNGTANAYGFNNANYTLEFWFRCTAGTQTLITDRRGDNERGQERADDLADGACFQNWFQLAVAPSGYVAFWIADDATSSGTGDIQLNSPGGLIQFNEWNHIAIVKSRASGADAYFMYINGNLAAQRGALGIYNTHKTMTPANRISFTTGCLNTPVDGSVSHRIELGRWDNSSGISGQVQQYTDGRMDELRMWNVALTQDQIRDRMFDVNWAAQPQHYHAMNITGNTGVTVPDDGSSGFKMGFTTGSPYTVNRFDASQAPISDATGAALNEYAAEDNWGTRGIWSITNTNRSFSSGGLSMQVAADLTIANWANYNVSNRATTLNSAPGDVPTGVSQRYDQIWYNFEQGTVTPNMYFDMSVIQNAAVPTLFPASNYYLLYRTGTSGPFSIVQTGASAISGNTIQFNTVALATGYYAIGLCTPPVITAQPQPKGICIGSTASFSVAATGTALAYQWQYSTDNGTTWLTQADGTTAATGTFTGSTTPTLQVTNAQLPLSGTLFRAVITSGACSINSNAVAITVSVISSVTASVTNLTTCTGGEVDITYTTVPTGQQVMVVRQPGNIQGAGDVQDFPINNTTAPISYTYSAYIPSVSGCPSNTAVTVVTVNPQPTITPSQCSQTICSGQTGAITFTSNFPNETIHWTRTPTTPAPSSGTGNIGQSFTNTGPTSLTYTYTIWAEYPAASASCPTSNTITCTIVVDPCCQLVVSAASATATQVCPNGTITLTASTTGAVGTLTYNWTGPNYSTTTNLATVTIPNATVSQSGMYTLVVTDNGAANCTKTDSVYISVSPLSAAAESNSPQCQGNTLELYAFPPETGGPFTYLWSGPNGFVSTSQNPTLPNATTAATGNYTLVVTDTQSGCSGTAVTAVTIATQPNLTLAGGNSQTICSGQAASITINGSNGANIAWVNNFGQFGTGNSINTGTLTNFGTAPIVITYQAIASAGGGTCSDTTSFTVVVLPVPTIQVVPGRSVVCNLEQTSVRATVYPSTAVINWTRTPATNPPASGSSNTGTVSITEILPPDNYSYQFTATQDGCTSPVQTVSVTVQQ